MLIFIATHISRMSYSVGQYLGDLKRSTVLLSQCILAASDSMVSEFLSIKNFNKSENERGYNLTSCAIRSASGNCDGNTFLGIYHTPTSAV